MMQHTINSLREASRKACRDNWYRVYFVNFDYYSQNVTPSLEAAKLIAKNSGFECVIRKWDGTNVCSYSTFSGFKSW